MHVFAHVLMMCRFRELDGIRTRDAAACEAACQAAAYAPFTSTLDSSLGVLALASSTAEGIDSSGLDGYQPLHTPTSSARGGQGQGRAYMDGTLDVRADLEPLPGAAAELAVAEAFAHACLHSVLPLPGFTVQAVTGPDQPLSLLATLDATRLQHRAQRIAAGAGRAGLDMDWGSHLAHVMATKPNGWLSSHFGVTALECRKLRQLLAVSSVGYSGLPSCQLEQRRTLSGFQSYHAFQDTTQGGCLGIRNGRLGAPTARIQAPRRAKSLCLSLHPLPHPRLLSPGTIPNGCHVPLGGGPSRL